MRKGRPAPAHPVRYVVAGLASVEPERLTDPPAQQRIAHTYGSSVACVAPSAAPSSTPCGPIESVQMGRSGYVHLGQPDRRHQEGDIARDTQTGHDGAGSGVGRRQRLPGGNSPPPDPSAKVASNICLMPSSLTGISGAA